VGDLNWAFTIRDHSESSLFAFVPVELFLQISLGVLDSRECAQRNREFLAASGAGGNTWHRAQGLTILTARFVKSLMLGATGRPVNALGG
jgi:hypothetical protein